MGNLSLWMYAVVLFYVGGITSSQRFPHDNPPRGYRNSFSRSNSRSFAGRNSPRFTENYNNAAYAPYDARDEPPMQSAPTFARPPSSYQFQTRRIPPPPPPVNAPNADDVYVETTVSSGGCTECERLAREREQAQARHSSSDSCPCSGGDYSSEGECPCSGGDGPYASDRDYPGNGGGGYAGNADEDYPSCPCCQGGPPDPNDQDYEDFDGPPPPARGLPKYGGFTPINQAEGKQNQYPPGGHLQHRNDVYQGPPTFTPMHPQDDIPKQRFGSMPKYSQMPIQEMPPSMEMREVPQMMNQGPRMDVPMQQPPMDMPMQQPPMNIPMQNPPINNQMQQPPMNIPMQNPPMDMPMQQPPMNIPMQNAPMDMPMQNAPMDIPMQQPPMNIPMQNPPMDMPMQQPPMEMPMQHPQMVDSPGGAIQSPASQPFSYSMRRAPELPPQTMQPRKQWREVSRVPIGRYVGPEGDSHMDYQVPQTKRPTFRRTRKYLPDGRMRSSFFESISLGEGC